MQCVVCSAFVLNGERNAERHLRTREHLCNIVYNLWIDPREFLDGDEPYTCEFCYNV